MGINMISVPPIKMVNHERILVAANKSYTKKQHKVVHNAIIIFKDDFAYNAKSRYSLQRTSIIPK